MAFNWSVSAFAICCESLRVSEFPLRIVYELVLENKNWIEPQRSCGVVFYSKIYCLLSSDEKVPMARINLHNISKWSQNCYELVNTKSLFSLLFLHCVVNKFTAHTTDENDNKMNKYSWRKKYKFRLKFLTDISKLAPPAQLEGFLID